MARSMRDKDRATRISRSLRQGEITSGCLDFSRQMLMGMNFCFEEATKQLFINTARIDRPLFVKTISLNLF